jgi:hypothetical protein
VTPLLFLLLAQTPPVPAPAAPARAGERPVRVWLGSSSPLVRGAPVRVYVETGEDGYLVVLRARTDGRIQVLFPPDPTADALVRAGTYEIRRANDGEAFVVVEPDGTGMVLAALSPGSLRIGEFVHQADWNPDALAPSWPGADGEGALIDVVQRMAGDGYFNYDFITYTVAPPSYAQQETTPLSPEYSSCLGCSFVNVTLFVPQAAVACDPFLAPCLGFPFARRHVPFCGQRTGCFDRGTTVTAVGATVVPLYSRTALSGRSILRSRRFVVPPRPRSIPVIGPRVRVPDRRSSGRATVTAGAAPVGARRLGTQSSGRIVIPLRSRPVSQPAMPVQRRWWPTSSSQTVIPLTGAAARPPIADEPERARSHPAASGLMAVPPPLGTAVGALERPAPPAPRGAPASRQSGSLLPAGRPHAVAQPLLPLSASPRAGATSPTRALAPTSAAWQGPAARTRTAGRRH